jgi:hypothetical protein
MSANFESQEGGSSFGISKEENEAGGPKMSRRARAAGVRIVLGIVRVGNGNTVRFSRNGLEQSQEVVKRIIASEMRMNGVGKDRKQKKSTAYIVSYTCGIRLRNWSTG